MTSAVHPSPAGPLGTFRYEAQSLDGQTFRGTLEAPSAAAVNAQLSALSLRVLVVESAPATPARRSTLGPDDFFMFNQQLAHLTAAGLPVERGLRLIAADLRSGRLANAAKAVAEELERGVPLAQAFARHASQFPPLYGRLIEAGVQAGNLPGMLFNLGHHLELVSKLRSAIWRTVAYPLMVVAAMSLVFLFISLTVLPQYGEIYRDFRTTLPTITELVISLGAVYPTLWVGGVVVVVAGIILVGVLRAAGKITSVAERFLWVPVIGTVLRASLLARWIDALRLSIEAGLDLPRAIALASDATGSSRIAREGKEMSEVLTSGRPSTDFSGRLIPQTVPAAIDLASGSGDLQSTLATLSRMYQQQAEHQIRLIPVLITPISLLLIAGAVILIIIAMFLPLVRLIQSVSGGE